MPFTRLGCLRRCCLRSDSGLLMDMETVVENGVRAHDCALCGRPVPHNEAVLRSRRLVEVLAWHPECFRADQRVPSQRIF